jgi:hypothetical protein
MRVGGALPFSENFWVRTRVQQILRGFSYALYRASHTLTLIVLSTGVKTTSSLALGGTPDGSTDPTPRLPAAVPRERVPQSLDEFQPIAVEEPSQEREVAGDTPSDPAEHEARDDVYHEALLHRALDALKSEHKHLHGEAINHLAGLEDPRAMQTLVQVALDGGGLDARLRLQAVGALVQHAENLQFTDSVPVDVLKTLSEDTDANVRSIAQRALQHSKQHQHGPQ